ncbi:MAG: tRNA lysidine(34) synthetase TilS [Acholeplasmatales bacterium]|nr:tRNA lysidine(34) synthetase TilS [Acholeplasmatales bacterium]
MEKRVLSFLKDNNININKPIVVAVSGGADSIALLNILYNLKYNIVIAHVNHHMRLQSEEEEQYIIKLANKLNIPYEILEYHFEGNDNFHNASHNARYKFFRLVCDKYNTNLIATAHHLDDQAETILMKLMEGSNLYGYGGISICNDDGNYQIIRPLLCVSKKELYNYCDLYDLKYYEDSSNHEDHYLRNRLRHHIIPLLKNECNDFYSKILEYSIQLKEAFNYIRNESKIFLDKYDNKIKLDEFKALDVALRKDIISLLLERYNIRKNNDIINDINNFLLDTNGTKSLILASNNKLIRSYDYAFISTNEKQTIEEVTLNFDESIIYNNKYKFSITKNITSNGVKYIKLCYNKLVFPIHIRPRKNGDEIDSISGTKKLSRVFIDSKVSKEIRDLIPIITDNDDNILWVYDYIKSKDVFSQRDNADIYLVCEEF